MAGVPNLFYSGGPPPSPVNFARPPDISSYTVLLQQREVFIFKLFLLTKTFVLPYYYSTACHKKKKNSIQTNFKLKLYYTAQF